MADTEEPKDAAQEVEDDLDELADRLLSLDFKSSIRTASAGSEPSTNFTWEHFFTKHCGILRLDALKYEKALIAHRMDPLDTLLESIGLIVEYGRIPIGDKLKIIKTIDKAAVGLHMEAGVKAKAKESLGLSGYSDIDASTILDLAGGDTKDHIDWGIEQYVDGQMEMERMINVQILKNPKMSKLYRKGASEGREFYNPVFQLLHSFGYTSFEYTKDKQYNDETVVPSCATSSNPALQDILCGNMESTTPTLPASYPEYMYS